MREGSPELPLLPSIVGVRRIDRSFDDCITLYHVDAACSWLSRRGSDWTQYDEHGVVVYIPAAASGFSSAFRFAYASEKGFP